MWLTATLTLSVFGVGRRTVGRGPGRQPQFWRARDDGRKSLLRLDDVAAATKRRTTSRLTVCGTQLSTSGRFPHPSNYFR